MIVHQHFLRRLAGLLVLLAAACSPAAMVEVQTPSGVVDPNVVTSAAGATQLYNHAVNNFSQLLGGNRLATGIVVQQSYVLMTALFTDELMQAMGGGGEVDRNCFYDERNGSTAPSGCYNSAAQGFHRPRIQARQAREALQLYTPGGAKALQGQLYALEAYTLLWFAELYCSGVPLTTVSLTGSVVLTPGFTTQELFTRAIVMFDSAMTLGSDTVRFVNLAKVGKGRALLGLGRFADATAAVQGVPTDFVYNTEHNASTGSNMIAITFRELQVVDNEGSNGLTWSVDPRTAVTTAPASTGAMKVPAKYSKTSAGTLDATQIVGDNPVRAADGLEARLIEAEADLATGGTNWLSILNALRNTCVGSTPCVPVPGLTAAALPPLADPGTAGARLDLLMKERAMWLFFTGHRQGDLRRLAHVYHRDQALLWPTGTYQNAGFPPLVPASPRNGTAYGNDAVWILSQIGANTEFMNPLYQGCFNADP